MVDVALLTVEIGFISLLYLYMWCWEKCICWKMDRSWVFRSKPCWTTNKWGKLDYSIFDTSLIIFHQKNILNAWHIVSKKMLGIYKLKYMHLNENIYIKQIHKIITQLDLQARVQYKCTSTCFLTKFNSFWFQIKLNMNLKTKHLMQINEQTTVLSFTNIKRKKNGNKILILFNFCRETFSKSLSSIYLSS